MNLSDYPTPWQRKMLWSALTAVAVVTIGAIAIGIIWLCSRVLGFLQPILIPFAVAGVMAYLLDPVVSRIVAWGTSRQRAVLAVFAVVSLAVAGILVWIVPAIATQGENLARKVPGYTQRAKERVVKIAADLHTNYGITLLPEFNKAADSAGPSIAALKTVPATPAPAPEPPIPTTPLAAATTGTAEVPETPVPEVPEIEKTFDLQHLLSGNWLQNALLATGKNLWNVIRTSVGGFLGVLGFILSMVIVPVYLYYLLIESRNIASGWQNYLPLRASAFKDEVVTTLSEINGYLIAFFRGQLVVSLINGTATGIGLVIVGLDFGLLIGLLLCVLGLIPYLGIILCWIPAVIIASVQGGSWLIPGTAQWWVFPLVVSAIFIIVQQIDGLFITPKVVGESVGLHPMTVIASVFVWSLLMGGLLGAILAVPMTATLKVILRRYVWERRFRSAEMMPIVTEETFSLRQALERDEPQPSLVE